MAGYQDLQVWKMSMRLALDIYKTTTTFPETERYGLTSQLRRAAVSVPSNIAEGHARDSAGDLARFCNISLGSLAEVETQLLLARELGYAERADAEKLLDQADQVGRMLRGLIRSTKRPPTNP
ncbi:four helix bundle protein [Botrimarina mediterranea]|nr:four helix bundle protein [Botrimarina mediterranea]